MSKQSAALSYATQHAMLSEFGGKWEAEFRNTRLPLSTLLHAGYSVKLKINIEVISCKVMKENIIIIS